MERPELTPELVQTAAARIRQTRVNYAAGLANYITRVYDPLWAKPAPQSDYSMDLNILADWACQELETK